MKKIIYTVNLFFICFVVILCMNTPTFATAKYSHGTLLLPDQIYYYDLDGDGEKESIQYTHLMSSPPLNYISYLMINGVVVAEFFIGDSTHDSRFYLCDYNSKDKRLDLYRLLIEPDQYGFTLEDVIRYNSKQDKYEVFKRTDNRFFDWGISGPLKNIKHPEKIRLNGKNSIDIALYVPFDLAPLGDYIAWFPMKIKNNKLVYDNVKTFEFASRGDTLKNKIQYTLNKNCPLYTSPKLNSTKKKTLKKGETISVLKIMPLGKKKQPFSDISRSGFVYIKDKTNTYGWIYIEKEKMQYEQKNKNTLFR